MDATGHRRTGGCGIWVAAAAFLLGGQLTAATFVTEGNVISRLARIFNPRLVEVETRIDYLDRQVADCAPRYEHALKEALGYRGGRSRRGGPDPTVVVDLGAELPLRTIFLIPAQREHSEEPGIFPKRFTLDVASSADFAGCRVLFTSGSSLTIPPDGFPVQIPAAGVARYVRLTVHEGHHKGILDMFGLAEIVVISEGEPVSFGAKVSTDGDFSVPSMWFPEALTDGQTPLGIWHSGRTPDKLVAGDLVDVADPAETTTWTIELPAAAPLDRLEIFPYQFNHSFEASLLPERLTVELAAANDQPGEQVYEWVNPQPGASKLTPLVIPLHQRTAKVLHLTARRAAQLGDRRLHALSEMQLWSAGHNLALNQPVQRQHAGQSTSVTTVTDGYSSQKKIIPVGIWLHQLVARATMEHELTPLRAVQRHLATDSELNATWGSAMVLGLTFLIPVIFVERRRSVTQDQLDQIRKRISADLHDDIGSNLGSISLIARTAHKDLVRLAGPPQIADDLAEVEAIARESSLAMRDIVWLIERKHDSVGDLVQRMREVANRLLREIDFTLECASTKTTTRLSLDAKRHLFLFFKESIHNIVKHSRATRVSVRLWDEGDQLAMEICDNGVGIPLTTAARPALVNKLEDRARVMNGICQIHPSAEGGTCIRLHVKRSHLTRRRARS